VPYVCILSSVISTLTGSFAPLGHSKQIRHWSLMRMLYWPWRSPRRGSNAFAGQGREVLQDHGGFKPVEPFQPAVRNGELLDPLAFGKRSVGTKCCSPLNTSLLARLPSGSDQQRFLYSYLLGRPRWLGRGSQKTIVQKV
jgi:hypothetical protein